jgi:anti-sigma factor ChrR (cupin superfamily)
MSHSTEEAQVRAALYTLGVLPEDEIQEFLEEDGQTAAVNAFKAVVKDLAYAAPPHKPPEVLRSRVLSRIAEIDTREQSATAPTAAPIVEKPGLLFTRSALMDWKGDNTPVQVKTLSKDPEAGYRLSLIRMVPGAVLPPHRHADVEDSYVLEGEMLVSGVLMRPGDHCRAEPGSLHTGVISRTGCIFIARASLHDEF